MSIRYGLLALLDAGPAYGAQLRAAFESRTGSAWPLNIGQVYTTLARLERDGLVEPAPGGDPKQRPYALTPAGRRELTDWYARPVDRAKTARDELAIKLAMALTAPGTDTAALIRAQRRHTTRAVRHYTRLRTRALAAPPESPTELAWLLVLERLIADAEAETRWLDRCEAVLGEG